MLVTAISSFITAVALTASFAKVFKGTKLKLILAISALLIASNIAEILINVQSFLIFSKEKASSLTFAIYGTEGAGYYVTFNVGHHLLAWQYKMLSQNIPKILDESTVSESSFERKGRLYKVLLVLNYLVPVCFEVFLYFFNEAVFVRGETKVPFALELVLSVLVFGVYLLQIISGTILTKSVLSIRNFYRLRDEEELLDTKMVVLHAFAFGTYLLTAFLTAIFATLLYIFPTQFRTVEALVSNISILVGDIAMVLLAAIFWDLGTINEEENRKSVESLRVEDFD